MGSSGKRRVHGESRTNHAVGSSCFSPCPGSCEWGRPGPRPRSQPLCPEKWKTRSPCRWLRAAPAEYAADDQAGYDADAAASDADAALAMLQGSIPGVPGEDYPIYAEVPESGFACDGQVDGGYYADPEAECQAFHICTADGAGGLAKYSFLCPNGTLFNQNYFICDWWFNFDCSTAEELYSLNDEIAAERDALAAAGGDAPGDYAAPPAEYASEGSGAPEYEAPARRGRAKGGRRKQG